MKNTKEKKLKTRRVLSRIDEETYNLLVQSAELKGITVSRMMEESILSYCTNVLIEYSMVGNDQFKK